jgi:hypothetical protein
MATRYQNHKSSSNSLDSDPLFDMTKPLRERYAVLGFVTLYTPGWETAPSFSEGFNSVGNALSLILALIDCYCSHKN